VQTDAKSIILMKERQFSDSMKTIHLVLKTLLLMKRMDLMLTHSEITRLSLMTLISNLHFKVIKSSI